MIERCGVLGRVKSSKRLDVPLWKLPAIARHMRRLKAAHAGDARPVSRRQDMLARCIRTPCAAHWSRRQRSHTAPPAGQSQGPFVLRVRLRSLSFSAGGQVPPSAEECRRSSCSRHHPRMMHDICLACIGIALRGCPWAMRRPRPCGTLPDPLVERIMTRRRLAPESTPLTGKLPALIIPCPNAAQASCSIGAGTAASRCCSCIRAGRSGPKRMTAPGAFPRAPTSRARSRWPRPRREFAEETGARSRARRWRSASFRQSAAKIVDAWAVEGDFDPAGLESNTFAMEWPPRSGRMGEFPEVDRAQWFTPEEAARKILKGQRPILEALLRHLGEGGGRKFGGGTLHMTPGILINIDVDDLQRATAFYMALLDLRIGRRFGAGGVELVGGAVPFYLLVKPAGSAAARQRRSAAAMGGTGRRCISTSWSPMSTRPSQRRWLPARRWTILPRPMLGPHRPSRRPVRQRLLPACSSSAAATTRSRRGRAAEQLASALFLPIVLTVEVARWRTGDRGRGNSRSEAPGRRARGRLRLSDAAGAHGASGSAGLPKPDQRAVRQGGWRSTGRRRSTRWKVAWIGSEGRPSASRPKCASLREELPTVVGDVMREVLREQKR